jgi:cytochrome c-type biogenesis protein CcmH
MTGFLVAAAALTLIALVVLLRPLFRPRRPPAEERGEPAADLFRRQLSAIDEELAEGRLSAAEGEAARAEITRRLLAAAEREEAGADAAFMGGGDYRWRFAAAVGIAGVLPAAAVAVYFAVGAPSAIERAAPEAAIPHSDAELATAVDQLQAHLQQAPDDLKGWTLLGRTLVALGRLPQALNAYNRAVALAPADVGLHAELGEVLVQQAQGIVTPDAVAQFAKAPGDPRSRYYDAEAALQQGDQAGAKHQLQALLADAPADAPWRQAVADRLAELSPSDAGTAPAAATAPAGGSNGPTRQDVAAAAAQTPEQQQAMIRGMVERLAQRLDQHPADPAGWERLAHAYDVLGEPDKAAAARAGAAAASAAPAASAPPASAAEAAPDGAAAAASPRPTDASGWLERARLFEAQARPAEALATLKQGNAALPGNQLLLHAYLNALAGEIKDDKPTLEVVAVANQLNALDAKQPDALWYLGLAAAQNGDRFRAASYWTKLMAELAPGDAQRAIVQRRLDALR